MCRIAGCLTLFVVIFATHCFSQASFISFKDKRIAYEGRMLYTTDAATLIWPGTSVTVRFMGSSISARLKDSDTSNYYNVLIDGKQTGKFHFDTTLKTYLLAAGLSKGPHTLQLFKRTEWDKGRTWFYGFELGKGVQLLAPPAKPARKIEFYGNSITCGYAIEDYMHDSPIGYYENNYDAYAAITARHFNAQYHCIAKSGIGITVSWFPLIMPEMYDRIDPLDSTSKWNFASYIPDLVVINLLQNDSWIVKLPKHDQFKARFGSTPPTEEYIINAYKRFVQSVRSKYPPQVPIICMLGNMDITRAGSPWPAYVEKAVAMLHDDRVFTLFIPYKDTPGHPKTAEQKVLADGLIKFIGSHVKW